jgi:hypothetical protein
MVFLALVSGEQRKYGSVFSRHKTASYSQAQGLFAFSQEPCFGEPHAMLPVLRDRLNVSVSQAQGIEAEIPQTRHGRTPVAGRGIGADSGAGKIIPNQGHILGPTPCYLV